jgi:ABC-type amino acid transport/signal transduction systems, periplasmic component/domain
MKKVLSLVMALVLAFALVGCNKTETPSTALEAWEQELGTPGVIKVGISPDYEPYEYYDEDGNIVGFDVDMANELMAYIGGDTPYTIEFVVLDFNNIISALNAGSIDIGISCFTANPERDCAFTEPYLNSMQVVVVANDSGITSVEQLVGKTVAAGENTTGAGVAEDLAEEYGEMNIISPGGGGGYPAMFGMLESGAVSAVVCDNAVGQAFVNSDPDKFTILEGEYAVENTCVIVKKTNTELYAIVNDAVIQFNASDKKAELVELYELIAY